MQILKYDTAIKVRIGPFVDVGDGFTPQVDIGNPDTNLTGVDEAELLKHNGVGTVSIVNNTWEAITDCDGWYNLTLTTSNTDTHGLLTVVIQDDSDCLPVFAHFMVVSKVVYDSLYAAATTDYLPVDLTQIGGSATGIANLDADYDGTGYVGGTIVKQADVTKLGGVAQSATDLKDFADAGYDPTTDKVQGVVLVDTTTTNTDQAGIKKNTQLSNFVFFMVLSSDHVTPATGKTIVETISKDGGSFAACSNTFAEIGDGFYKITLTSTEMNADIVALKFTETDSDQRSIIITTS